MGRQSRPDRARGDRRNSAGCWRRAFPTAGLPLRKKEDSMDTPTPSLREQGIQALREGQLDQAIDLLARAITADSQDAEAQAYLGVAYGQNGLHAQARQALERAVELQPKDAHHRYNLGAVLERAGDRQGAVQAYRDALQLDPGHAQARARLQTLGLQVHAPDAGTAQPRRPESGPPPAVAPWLRGVQPAGTTAPAGPPGTVQCPRCGQWSKARFSCEWCRTPLPSAPAP